MTHYKIRSGFILTPHQERIVSLFKEPNSDYHIHALYCWTYGLPKSRMTIRQMQQTLAPNFSAINAKLTKGKIVPGELKRTYRLKCKV